MTPPCYLCGRPSGAIVDSPRPSTGLSFARAPICLRCLVRLPRETYDLIVAPDDFEAIIHAKPCWCVSVAVHPAPMIVFCPAHPTIPTKEETHGNTNPDQE